MKKNITKCESERTKNMMYVMYTGAYTTKRCSNDRHGIYVRMIMVYSIIHACVDKILLSPS